MKNTIKMGKGEMPADISVHNRQMLSLARKDAEVVSVGEIVQNPRLFEGTEVGVIGPAGNTYFYGHYKRKEPDDNFEVYVMEDKGKSEALKVTASRGSMGNRHFKAAVKKLLGIDSGARVKAIGRIVRDDAGPRMEAEAIGIDPVA